MSILDNIDDCAVCEEIAKAFWTWHHGAGQPHIEFENSKVEYSAVRGRHEPTSGKQLRELLVEICAMTKTSYNIVRSEQYESVRISLNLCPTAPHNH